MVAGLTVSPKETSLQGAALIRRCCLGKINVVQKLFDDVHCPVCSPAKTLALSRPGI